MKTNLAGFLGSIAALTCGVAVAGDSSDVTKDTETLDKLKVIETINVTSSKEIDGSKSDKVDPEVLKILKAADQDSGAKSTATKEKLQIIETINVTALKEVDETKDVEVDVEVEKVLKEVEDADGVSGSDQEAQAASKIQKVYAKKFERDNVKLKLVEGDSDGDGKSIKLTKSQTVLKNQNSVSLAKTRKIKQADENDKKTEAN